MDRESVIRMAREANAEITTAFNYHSGDDMFIFFDIEILERFASLVAAAEMERAAREVEDWDSDSADPRDVAAAIRALP